MTSYSGAARCRNASAGYHTVRPRHCGARRDRAARDTQRGRAALVPAATVRLLTRTPEAARGSSRQSRQRGPADRRTADFCLCGTVCRRRGRESAAPPHDRPPVGRCPAGGRQGASTSLPFRPWAPAAVSWHFCALTAGGTRVLSLSCEARHAAAAQTLHWWTAGAVHVAGRRAARARGGASAGGRGARAAAQPVRLRPFRGAAGSLRAHAFGGSVVGCLLLRGGCLFPTGVGSLLLRRLHGHPQAPAARHRHRGVH